MKTKIFSFIVTTLFLFYSISCSSSTTTTNSDVEIKCALAFQKIKYNYHMKIELLSFFVWDTLEPVTPPSIIGGVDSLLKKIRYPEIPKRAGVRGPVICEFIVTKSGTAQNIHIVQGIGSGCDEEVISAIRKTMFNPAEYNGEKIDQLIRAAINFSIRLEPIKNQQF